MIGTTLQTLRGRSIIRNTKGLPTVDIDIDVEHGHITGFSGLGGEGQTYDGHLALSPGTYWGPLINDYGATPPQARPEPLPHPHLMIHERHTHRRSEAEPR